MNIKLSVTIKALLIAVLVCDLLGSHHTNLLFIEIALCLLAIGLGFLLIKHKGEDHSLGIAACYLILFSYNPLIQKYSNLQSEGWTIVDYVVILFLILWIIKDFNWFKKYLN